MINMYVAEFFSILAWCLIFISYYKNRDNKLLITQSIACFFFGISYYLLGAYTGLVIVIYDILRDYLYIKINDDKKLFLFTIPLYILIGYFSYDGLLSIVAVIASAIDGYALTYKGKKVLLYSMFSYLLWIIYDYYYFNYINVICQLVIIISNLCILIRGYSIFLRSDKLIIGRDVDIDSAKLLYSIDKNNYNKKYLWNTLDIENFIKSNRVDYINIYDSHKLIGYVNFIGISLERYNSIKKNNTYSDISVNEFIKLNKKTDNYILIDMISILEEYKNSKSIELISNYINKYINRKNHSGYNIKGIICIGVNDFECMVINKLGFVLISKNDERCLYVLERVGG